MKPDLLFLGVAMTVLMLSANADEHAHHQSPAPATASAAPPTQFSVRLPEVEVIRQDNRRSPLIDELSGDGPIVLAFIYTSCTAVCPVTSQIMAKIQEKLGSNPAGVRLVSISIDPEYDTPARLRDYADKVGAGPFWFHYTGTRTASRKIQRAFDAYFGDKMNHQPAIYVRARQGPSWVRIDGFPTADKVLETMGKRG